MKYFKVKIGYGADDFISVDETELRKAINAQVTGKVGIFNEGTVAGNSIISITPDFNREMGYHRDYKLTGEDYGHIGNKNIDDSRKLLESVRNEVLGIATKPPYILEESKKLADKLKIK